jgi:hypothetical protein
MPRGMILFLCTSFTSPFDHLTDLEFNSHALLSHTHESPRTHECETLQSLELFCASLGRISLQVIYRQGSQTYLNFECDDYRAACQHISSGNMPPSLKTEERKSKIVQDSPRSCVPRTAFVSSERGDTPFKNSANI